MDQREHDVEEDLKSILRTRMALAEKVQSLEQRVQDTVRCTRETAMDTLDGAKKMATQWMTSPTGRLGSFDLLAIPVRRFSVPSMIAGSAVAIGLLTIWMKQGKQHRRSGVYPYYPHAEDEDVMSQERRSGVYPYYPPRAEGAKVMSQGEGSRQGTGESRRESGESNVSPLRQQMGEFVNGLKNEVTQERMRVQQAALQVARSFARDMVRFAGQSLVLLINQVSAGGRARSRNSREADKAI